MYHRRTHPPARPPSHPATHPRTHNQIYLVECEREREREKKRKRGKRERGNACANMTKRRAPRRERALAALRPSRRASGWWFRDNHNNNHHQIIVVLNTNNEDTHNNSDTDKHRIVVMIGTVVIIINVANILISITTSNTITILEIMSIVILTFVFALTHRNRKQKTIGITVVSGPQPTWGFLTLRRYICCGLCFRILLLGVKMRVHGFPDRHMCLPFRIVSLLFGWRMPLACRATLNPKSRQAGQCSLHGFNASQPQMIRSPKP